MHQISILLLTGALLYGCSASRPGQTPPHGSGPALPEILTVFAAASLAEAFTETGQQFSQANPGVEVIYNFAGSQQLAQQLAQGAPVDVFASADGKHMEAAIQAGRVRSGNEQAFAHNRLIVVLPPDNPRGINRLQDLAKPGMKLVLAAEAVPVGEYSLQFLEKASQDPSFGASYKNEVMKNVVSYEENVRAVLSKVILGEADAGIVYVTDLHSHQSGDGQSLEIPDQLNIIADYYIAPIPDSKKSDLARDYIDFVLSSEGQEILERYGFSQVP